MLVGRVSSLTDQHILISIDSMLRHRIALILSSSIFILLSSCVSESRELCPNMEQIGFAPTTEALRTLEEGSERAEERCVGVIPLQSDAPGVPQLYLHLYESDLANTETTNTLRAAPLTTDGLTSVGSYAYTYAASETFEGSLSRQTFMNNLEVTRASSWNTGLYWPGADKKISFFCYAPYNAMGVTIDGNPTADPSITYSTPTSVADQKDIVVATAMDLAGDSRQPVQLTFKHILTGIRFKVGDKGILPGTITRIHLKNVMPTRVYNFVTATWAPQGVAPMPTNTFSLDQEIALTGQPGAAIGSEAETFMMIPQRFVAINQRSKIEVGYRDSISGEEYTLTASLAGQKWEPGKMMTYKVSLSSISAESVLQLYDEAQSQYDTIAHVTRQWQPADYVDLPFRVKSYTKIVSSQKTTYKPLSWRAEFSTDEGASWSSTPPSWLVGFPQSGPGTDSESAEEPHTAQIQLQPSPVYLGDYTLRQAPPQSGIVDLSEGHRDSNGHVMGRTTANCYLVHAPGTYRFPMVYGNAYRDGQVNATAYTCSGRDAPNPFRDGLNNVISSPNLRSASQVALLWDDGCEPVAPYKLKPQVQNVQLVKNPKGDGVDYIQFTIPTEIYQANAVIAAKDATGTIIWSWHIWVTPYRSGYEHQASEREVSNNGYTYHLWNYALGHYDYRRGYPERKVIVRFTQQGGVSDTPRVAYLHVLKDIYIPTAPSREYACLYQWGRKDPFSTKYYRLIEESTSVTSTINRAVSLYESVRNPTSFVTRGGVQVYTWYKWSEVRGYALWNTQQEDKVSLKISYGIGRKSVYDPSPVGYIVPPNGLWGNNIGVAECSYLNVGLIWCTAGAAIGDGINYWSSSPYVYLDLNEQSYALIKDKSGFKDDMKAKSFGFGVRPIREQWP